MSRSDIISPKMKRNFKMTDFKDDKREKTMIKPRLLVYLKLILSVWKRCEIWRRSRSDEKNYKLRQKADFLIANF